MEEGPDLPRTLTFECGMRKWSNIHTDPFVVSAVYLHLSRSNYSPLAYALFQV